MSVETEDIVNRRTQIRGGTILDRFLADLGLSKSTPNQEFPRNRTSIVYINQNVTYSKYSHGNRFSIDFRSFNPFIILTLQRFFVALRSPQVEKTDSGAGLDRQLRSALCNTVASKQKVLYSFGHSILRNFFKTFNASHDGTTLSLRRPNLRL